MGSRSLFHARRDAPVVIAAMLLAGCAAQRPYRIAQMDGGAVLLPPRVRSAVKLCAGERVDRAKLEAMQAGEFEREVAKLESDGCIAKGRGAEVERSAIESIALSFRALHTLTQPAISQTGYVDLRAGDSIRAVSPVFREGAAADAGIRINSVTGSGNRLEATGTMSNDVIGFETSWYSVGRCGIEARSAEVHVGGKTAPEAGPKDPLFHFAGGACLFRLFVLTRRSGSDHDVFVVAARNLTEMMADSEKLASEHGCDEIGALCRAIPRLVSVNGFVRVIVNGAGTDLEMGATVGDAVRQAAPAGLEVRRPYGKWLRSVTAPETRELLALPLEGGEEIAWKQ